MRLITRLGVSCTLIFSTLLVAVGSTHSRVDALSAQYIAPNSLVPQKAHREALRAEVPPGTPQVYPNDPGFVRGGPLDTLVNLPAAWAATTGSPNTIVATVDSGTASTPDVGPKIVAGYNVVSGNSDISDIDNVSHGTAVSSVMVAVPNDSQGVAGICGACRLVVVKVTTNAAGNGTNSYDAAGIIWAAQHGAKVINLSRGPQRNPVLTDAVNQATAAGSLVVLAAGNEGSGDPAVSPAGAASTNAIRVAGVNPDGSLYTGTAASNHGASWVELAAPYFGTAENTSGGTRNFSGTSYAAPVVAGVAALVYSYAQAHGQTLGPAQLKDILCRTATKVAGLDVSCGVVNAFAALRAVGYSPAATPKLNVVVNGTGSGSVNNGDLGVDCGAGSTDCSVNVQPGEKVELQASASQGSNFAGWSGACKGTNVNCSFTMPAGGASVTATFNRPKVMLRVLKSGSGTVTTVPAGISCSTRCLSGTHAFAYGTTVLLKAKPGFGYSGVSRWTGCTPIGKLKLSCKAKLTKATSVRVFFVKKK